MRKGQNPAKDSLTAYHGQRLGVAIVSFIPMQGAYFEHSLDVLKYEIASLHRSTSTPFDLYLFDNGSCTEVRSEFFRMQTEGWIDFLFASRYNLGKVGCINWILGSITNELICYADSDVIFRPGWFEKSLAILESFPQAGLIAAQPCLDDVLRGKGKAEEVFSYSENFQVDMLGIDPRWIDEYATGFGYSSEKGDSFKKKKYKVVTNKQSNTQAVIGASHVQFLIPRQVARQVGQLPATMSLSRKEDLNFNQKIDQLGYVHLSTLEPYYYHCGNTLDQNALNEIINQDLDGFLKTSPQTLSRVKGNYLIRIMKRLVRLPVLGSIVYRSYRFLFELYSQK